jgi:hypothetical protein
MNATDAKPSVLQVAASCLGSILRDEPWRDFGLRGRPRGGTVFQRFRASWKVALEKAVLQEMLIGLTAAHVVAGWITPDEINAVVDAYTKRELIRALGYSDQDTAVADLTRWIVRHTRTPARNWHELVAQRIVPGSIPDERVAARVRVGCITFAQNLETMILLLQADLRKHSRPTWETVPPRGGGFWETGDGGSRPPSTPLAKFMAQAGTEPYRDLIKHHIQRQSTQQMMKGVYGESELLSRHDLELPYSFTETFIDYLNVVLLAPSPPSVFWTMNCREAFRVLREMATEHAGGKLAAMLNRLTVGAESTPDDLIAHEVAFSVFQIATLNFAYNSSLDRRVRKHIGI